MDNEKQQKKNEEHAQQIEVRRLKAEKQKLKDAEEKKIRQDELE